MKVILIITGLACLIALTSCQGGLSSADIACISRVTQQNQDAVLRNCPNLNVIQMDVSTAIAS